MKKQPLPVTKRTINQIERISDGLFKKARAIPDVGPETEIGQGNGIEIDEQKNQLRLILRKDNSDAFFPRAVLKCCGDRLGIWVEDYRNNPVYSKSRGIIITSRDETGKHLRLVSSIQNEQTQLSLELIDDIDSSHNLNSIWEDSEARQFASNKLSQMLGFLRLAEIENLNSSGTRKS